ncbi:methyltransferase family protein [Aureimonas mangrovi]|uniref:methyltransferase family protein n=1 Tax=Aureimonas mangrovi TaxID=2758041 RepID=UPI00163D5659|nr:isoprenylcysteine carboxylmethyltransferase family protein [Aureimonas mangrovi]
MRAVRREFPDLPPIWALGTAILAWLAGLILPIWSFGGTAVTAIGALFVAAGVGLIAWSAMWFHRKSTSIEPRDVPKTLIVEGPFRLNRNPIYTGMALSVFGVALLTGALSALFIAFAFPPIVTSRFIAGEEETLRQTFGPEAERYMAGTRRW